MRLFNSLVALATVATVALFAAAPVQAQFDFLNIVDTDTIGPDGTPYGFFDGNPSLRNGNVTFIGLSSSGLGIFTANANGTGNLATVVTTADNSVPGGGNFFDLYSPVRGGNTTAFYW